MALEIMCMLIVAYILIFGTWTMPLFLNINLLHNFIENVFPKITGILILIYVIGKYLFKIN